MNYRSFSKLIMVEQTFFALPFAYIGILFAGGGNIGVWFWTTLALFAARTAGMSFNRVIDADIDAKNPRTKDRSIPSGEIKPRDVWLLAIGSSALLVFSSWMLNPICFYLSFPAVLLLFSYSFFKRFSSSSHLYLGFVEAAAPVGGYLAVTGGFSITPFILGTVILLWIAGLDMIYALMDRDFDMKEKLYSIPARFGKENAVMMSSACYIISFACMLFLGHLAGKKAPYWIAVTLIGCLFFYQQTLARRKDINNAVATLFKVNMFISPLLFFGSLIDIL